MKSGWNSKNTFDFWFDKNGNHAIYNMDGEIVGTDLRDSPFCRLQWEWFKEKYPTREVYETKMANLKKELNNLTEDDKNKLIEYIVKVSLEVLTN